MGLKWFRARLSINKKGTCKVPTMTGIYRKVSYSEPNILAMRKNEYTLPAVSSSIANNLTRANDKEQDDRAKDLTSKSPSLLNTDLDCDNHVIQNEEPTTSIKNSNTVEQFSVRKEEINKINKDQSHISNIRGHTSQETELVI